MDEYEEEAVVLKYIKWLDYTPRLRKFLCGIDLRSGCIIIGLLTLIIPICDIVQIIRFWLEPEDESDGRQTCVTQWWLKHPLVSPYVIYVDPVLTGFHFAFAVIYTLMGTLLIIGGAWENKLIIFVVLIGGIFLYIPSAIVYMVEILTAGRISFHWPVIWICFTSPLIWVYCISIVNGYFKELEKLDLIAKGYLVKPDEYATWRNLDKNPK